MDMITIIYLSMAGMIFLVFFVGLMVISGKSILFDILRRINPKGCDVFIINSHRQISQYYKKPKDGIFWINKKMYVSNPDKVMSMSEDMKSDVIEGMNKKKAKLQLRIKEFEKKKEAAEIQMQVLKTRPNAAGQVGQYVAYINEIDSRIAILQAKLEDKEQIYYNMRRGAFFYIENDPIPKDFHELYTEMDSIAIDNVIARSMTKDPKAVRDLEKELKMMKFMIIIAIIAAAAAAILSVSIKTDLTTIAQNLGVTLTI